MLWAKVAKQYDFTAPLSTENSDPDFIKDSVLKRLKEIFSIANQYPKNMIDAIGNEGKLANLPVLELGNRTEETEYIDSITTNEVKDAKIWRGIDRYQRPFITICAEYENRKFKPQVQTVFQRYTDEKRNWTAGKNDNINILNVSDYMRECNYEYLARLVRGENCGPWRYGHACNRFEGEKLTPDGRSFVRLTDQTSNDDGNDSSKKRRRI